MKLFRAWWRRRFNPTPPALYLPSIGWAHARHCIGGVPYEQAVQEEQAWIDDVTRRWLAGEKLK